MTQSNEPHENQPITLQQKQTLVAVYQRTGNMALAMREANIRSPKTAYLWWHRFCEDGEAGLQPRSHARHTQERLPNSVAEQICQLRRQHPRWGRRQIANELTQYHGRQVASPSSVEAVLCRAGLWGQGTEPAALASAPLPTSMPDWLDGGVDYGLLLETVQKGIQLSIQSEARAATHMLYHQIWRPLEADPTLWRRVLAMSKLSSWLLSSRLHLGHSLMNSGHWPQAVHYLQQTIDWMGEHASIGPRQRAWEDEPRFVSLRRDDVWLGCYQHLAIVLGKNDVERAVGILRTAQATIHRQHRPIMPGHRSQLGDLERDLAYLKLRLRKVPVAEIRQHLQHAQEMTEDSGSPGPLAFTHIAWARLHDRLAREAGEREHETRRQQRTLMERAMERAIQLVEEEREDRPMRLTLCFVDVAQLAAAHGMPVNGQQIQRAAQYSLTYGYGDQARELLTIPGLPAWLSDEVRRDLTSLARSR